MPTFQEVCNSFYWKAEEFACYLWFLEDQAVTYLFTEEEVLGNFYFPSGAHPCFSECFMDSCSWPSVARSGVLLEHIWIKMW